MITHLEVSVDNVMLVDVTDALQYLIDTVAKRELKKKKKHRQVSGSWIVMEIRKERMRKSEAKLNMSLSPFLCVQFEIFW